MDQMEIAPHTVEDVCTSLLAKPGLSANERGQALFVRARGYHRTGGIPLAAEDYEEALLLTPENAEIYVSRSNVALRKNDYASAISDLNRALDIDPKNPRALRVMGAMYGEFGDTKQALNYYAKALAADPAEPFALFFRSQVHAAEKRWDDALKDATSLVQIPPEAINRAGFVDLSGRLRDFHIIALHNRADLLSALERYDLAESDLNAAVEYGRTVDTLFMRGNFLRKRRGKEEAALSDFDEAIQLDPTVPMLHYRRGLTLAQLRRADQAIEAFDRSIALNPDADFVYWTRAQMHRTVGFNEEAYRDYARAMTLNPRFLQSMVSTLSDRGYLKSTEVPSKLTPALSDGLRACLIDPGCSL